jgi:ribosome biogenesis protein ENP2
MYDERQKQARLQSLRMVPADAQTESHGGHRVSNRDATFGQRRAGKKTRVDVPSRSADGGMEMSWIPSSTRGDDEEEHSHVSGRKGKKAKWNKTSMGVGLLEKVEMNEQERRGRKDRRKGVRSGSKNVFRRLG